MPEALAWSQVRPYWRWLLPDQCVQTKAAQPARHEVLITHRRKNKADGNVSLLEKAESRAQALFHTPNKTRDHLSSSPSKQPVLWRALSRKFMQSEE